MEMFEVIVVSKRLRLAENWLDRMGYYDLDGEEADEAERLSLSDMGILARDSRICMAHAIDALAERYPSLLARLTKRFESPLDYAKWMDHLVQSARRTEIGR
jgi:hypothetical protein